MMLVERGEITQQTICNPIRQNPSVNELGGRRKGEGNRHNGTRLTGMMVSSDRKWAEEQGDHEM